MWHDVAHGMKAVEISRFPCISSCKMKFNLMYR